ncbi:MAG: polysaccharide biosynthesis/export family protein [Cytophagales bacterium]|nr:polysaccharide biosynthesis/export family protein [Cytophaga sp.]
MARNIIYATLFIFLTASCYSTKTSIYFKDMGDETIISDFKNEPPIIQKNDILSIKISSLNPNASEVYNHPGTSTTTNSIVSGTASQASGYLVDADGIIQFPILGNLKAEGLTTKALEDTIFALITSRKLLLDPIVIVRYLNFKVSVLGEVENPSVYNVPSEKISLLEALALAGDLTIYAKRNNVLLIREEDGGNKLVRLDLSSPELFYSPYYYLKSNDIIYVEPKRSKVGTTHQVGAWLSAFFTATSLVIVIINSTKH